MLDAIDWGLIIWLALAALSGLGEALTGTLLLVPFAIAAIAAAIAVALGADAVWTLITFGSVCLVLLAVVLRFGSRLASEPAATHEGANRYIDARGVVTSRIPGRDAGRVLVGAEDWRALAHDDSPIDTGTRVRVIDIQGTALVVEPAQAGEETPD